MAGTRSIRNRLVFGIATLALVFSMLGPVGASAVDDDGALDMYTADVSGTEAAEIVAGGFDIADSRVTEDGVSLDIVLTDSEAKGLQARGLDVKVKKNKDGKSARQLAAEQAASGFNVWRSWDEPGGIRDELYRLAKENPQLVKLEVLGHTHQGRELIALKLTQGARGIADGTRPAVLHSSTQHAREWISTEVNRRLLNWYIDGWRANDEGDQRSPQEQRAVVRRRGQPRRLPVHVRHRAAVAEEPARQRQRRPDHAGRRRRSQPQLPRALRDTTRRVRRRRSAATPTVARRPDPSPRRRR